MAESGSLPKHDQGRRAKSQYTGTVPLVSKVLRSDVRCSRKCFVQYMHIVELLQSTSHTL